MTRPRAFDGRTARLWLLIGLLGLGAGATLRLYAPPAAAVPPHRSADAVTSGPVLLRRAAFTPVARTRAS